MSDFLGRVLGTLGELPERALLGATLGEAFQTEDPLWKSLGMGSRHHAELGERGASRLGFPVSQWGGKLIEDIESGSPESFPITAGASPPENLRNLPGERHFADPDTLKDMMANYIGGVMGAPVRDPGRDAMRPDLAQRFGGMTEKEKAKTLNEWVPVTRALPGISGKMETKQLNLDTGKMEDAPTDPAAIKKAQDFLYQLFGQEYGPPSGRKPQGGTLDEMWNWLRKRTSQRGQAPSSPSFIRG